MSVTELDRALAETEAYFGWGDESPEAFVARHLAETTSHEWIVRRPK